MRLMSVALTPFASAVATAISTAAVMYGALLGFVKMADNVAHPHKLTAAASTKKLV